MIKAHLQAVVGVVASIDDFAAIVAPMPECRDKYRLEAQLELLRRTAEDYADDSADLYDKICESAMALARYN